MQSNKQETENYIEKLISEFDTFFPLEAGVKSKLKNLLVVKGFICNIDQCCTLYGFLKKSLDLE